MNSTYERMLRQQAIKAQYKFSLGALIIKNGQVVGAGYNRAYRIGQSRRRADCAELLALKKTPKSLRPNSIIIVARLKQDGSYGMAKPCSRCERALGKAGINSVYYSSGEGWKKMRL